MLIEAHPSNFLTLAYVRMLLSHTFQYSGISSHMTTLVLCADRVVYFGITVNGGAGFWSGCSASQVTTEPCYSCLKPPAAVMSLLLLEIWHPNESHCRGTLLEHPVAATSIRPPGVNYAQEEEEEEFYKFLPANTANRLCQSWQSCSNHHVI